MGNDHPYVRYTQHNLISTRRGTRLSHGGLWRFRSKPPTPRDLSCSVGWKGRLSTEQTRYARVQMTMPISTESDIPGQPASDERELEKANMEKAYTNRSFCYITRWSTKQRTLNPKRAGPSKMNITCLASLEDCELASLRKDVPCRCFLSVGNNSAECFKRCNMRCVGGANSRCGAFLLLNRGAMPTATSEPEATLSRHSPSLAPTA